MKRPILLLTIVLSITFSSAQITDSISNRKYPNELGIDVTSLIHQVFFINASDFYSGYYPIYYATYRYRFPEWSIRTGIGGSFANMIEPSPVFYWFRICI